MNFWAKDRNHDLLSKLRNPHGWGLDDVGRREVRRAAADEIERLEREVSCLANQLTLLGGDE